MNDRVDDRLMATPSAGSAGILKTPPYSLEAEAAVLGLLLYDNGCFDFVVGVVAESDFYTGEHQLIFKAAHALISQNKLADAITVSQWLKDRDLLKRVQGGFEYILDLSQTSVSASNARVYAEVVHERAVMRAIIRAGEKMADIAYDPNGRNARQLLDQAQSLLADVDNRSKRGEGTFRSLSDALGELMSHLDDAEAPTGIRTGYKDLDRLMNPMQPGQLIVVGARPAVGKTSFAVNVAINVALQSKVAVGMFSMEMTDIELAVRILSGESGIPSGRFREHRLDGKHWDRINAAMTQLNHANFHIDQTGGLTIQELVARARVQSKRVGGFGLLIVDYVQLAHAEGRYDNRAVEIGAVTSGLKRLAKELACPVIALSQLNRDAAKEKKMPVISELRDSGSIESDADTILLLHRDYVATQKEEDMYDAKVIVGKQRNGGIGTMHMDYEPRLTKFYNEGEAPGRQFRAQKQYAERGGV